MTGLLDWGDTMFLGTIMICSSSAFAATDCGTCLRCVRLAALGRRRRGGAPVRPVLSLTPARLMKCAGSASRGALRYRRDG